MHGESPLGTTLFNPSHSFYFNSALCPKSEKVDAPGTQYCDCYILVNIARHNITKMTKLFLIIMIFITIIIIILIMRSKQYTFLQIGSHAEKSLTHSGWWTEVPASGLSSTWNIKIEMIIFKITIVIRMIIINSNNHRKRCNADKEEMKLSSSSSSLYDNHHICMIVIIIIFLDYNHVKNVKTR